MSAAFPGMVMPGAPAAQPQQQAGAGFVLNIPADPNWEPFETTDTLDKDGYYQARVKGEKPRTEQDKSPGVFLTLELLDPDVQGRTLSKFLPDPNTTKGNTWWIWRSLIRSIAGNTETAKGAFQYQPGIFLNRTLWIRTGAYNDDNTLRTGVEAFVLQQEHTDAVAAGRHRWAPKATAAGPAPVGALPSGLPAAFPGMGGAGLPGAPVTGGSVPQPSGAAPIQAPGFPQAAPAAAPAAAPVASTPFAFSAPPAAAAQAPAAFAFPPAPAAAAAPAAFAFPPAPAPAPASINGAAPQPAPGGFTGFPPAAH